MFEKTYISIHLDLKLVLNLEKLTTWTAAEMTNKSDTDSTSVVVGEKQKRVYRIAAALQGDMPGVLVIILEKLFIMLQGELRAGGGPSKQARAKYD